MFRTVIFVLSTACVFGQIPSGWKVMKEAGCQAAVPSSWQLDATPRSGKSKDGKMTVKLRSHSGVAMVPLTEMKQKDLGVDHTLENSGQRVFWVGKQVTISGKPTVIYTVEVPRKGGECTLHVNVPPGQSESDVKKIAMTLSPLP